MRWIAGIYLCLCALVACGGGANSHRIDLRHGWQALELVEAFDRAAHLKPPSAIAEPELRVWQAPFAGITGGYAISARRALQCDFLYRNDGITASVDWAHCAPSDMPVDVRDSALQFLPALSGLNGRSWGCAFGGATTFVEGFIGGKRFAFVVSNPGDCKDSGSLLVKRVLETLFRGGGHLHPPN
jgi:hypothetical protein